MLMSAEREQERGKSENTEHHGEVGRDLNSPLLKLIDFFFSRLFPA